jgi:hypothetical protein
MSLAATYLSVALLAGPGLPAESPTRTLECEGAATVGALNPGGTRLGPLHLPPREGMRGHWSPRARRFTSKIPLVVQGARAVTVSVPERLAGRLVMTYGGIGLSGEITFLPCAGRPATFFPGGLLFTRREPLALLVQVEGWPRPRVLKLGIFEPY